MPIKCKRGKPRYRYTASGKVRLGFCGNRVVEAKKNSLNQYELTTTKNAMDMPYTIYAKSKLSALRSIKKKLRKGEKILRLERVKKRRNFRLQYKEL